MVTWAPLYRYAQLRGVTVTVVRVIAAAGAPRPGHPACRDRSVAGLVPLRRNPVAIPGRLTCPAPAPVSPGPAPGLDAARLRGRVSRRRPGLRGQRQRAGRPAPGTPGSAGRPAAAAPAVSSAHDYRRACAATTRPGRMACMVLIRTNVAQHSQQSLRRGRPGRRPDRGRLRAGQPAERLQAAVRHRRRGPDGRHRRRLRRPETRPPTWPPTATAWGLPGVRQPDASPRSTRTGPGQPAARRLGQHRLGHRGVAGHRHGVGHLPELCHILLVEASSPEHGQTSAPAVNSAVSLGADVHLQQLRRRRSRPPTRASTRSTTSTPAWPSPPRRATTATASPTRRPRSTSPRSAAPR